MWVPDEERGVGCFGGVVHWQGQKCRLRTLSHTILSRHLNPQTTIPWLIYKTDNEHIKKKFPNEIRFGGVNSRIFHEIAERFEVTGWPWVSSFYMGEKVEDMAGLGGAESVINWATQKKNEVWKEGNGDVFHYRCLSVLSRITII